MKPGSRIPGLSAADEAAIAALAAGGIAVNKAVQELARAIAVERGVELPAPEPDKPRPKRRYRVSNVRRNVDGEIEGDVEVEEIEPAAVSESAVTSEPGGTFADVFGSIEGL